MRPVTQAERALLAHVSMWGSNGYPLQRFKRGGGWAWGTDDVPGPPCVFKTKREAVASFEAFLAILREASGEEACERARETAWTLRSAHDSPPRSWCCPDAEIGWHSREEAEEHARLWHSGENVTPQRYAEAVK